MKKEDDKKNITAYPDQNTDDESVATPKSGDHYSFEKWLHITNRSTYLDEERPR